MSSIDHELRLALSTGRVQLGSNTAERELRRGRARAVILSSNIPEERANTMKSYGNLADIPVLQHNKDSMDLGILCGKPYPVSALIINDPGDSRILDLVEEQ
jgi:large subunit ribosomal protein L30e